MLRGGVCGILGFGNVGVATARLMRAFGMRIHAINRRGASARQAPVILCIAAAGTECRGGERGIECPGFLRPACQAYRPAARLAECISCRPSKDGNREEAGAYNADCEQREGVLAGQLMGSPLKSLQGFGVPAESYGFANKRLAWETIAPLTPERLKPALA